MKRVLFALAALTIAGCSSATSVKIESPQPSKTPEAAANCVKAKGIIQAGTKFYETNQCDKPLGTLLALEERDGEKLIKLQFETGEVEWKTAKAVMSQGFIRTDDPNMLQADQ